MQRVYDVCDYSTICSNWQLQGEGYFVLRAVYKPGKPACSTPGTSEASSLVLRSSHKTNNA